MTETLMDLAVMLRRDADESERHHMAVLAGRLGYIAVHIPADSNVPVTAEEMARLVDAAAPAMVVVDDGTATVGMVRGRDLDAVRAARTVLDGSEDTRPLIVALPLSIGRTVNEATARADRDPRFVGDQDPRRTGIFGTFEQAQQDMLDLAHAGAEVVLVTVPHETDIADVLAQVKALVVGATPTLFRR